MADGISDSDFTAKAQGREVAQRIYKLITLRVFVPSRLSISLLELIFKIIPSSKYSLLFLQTINNHD